MRSETVREWITNFNSGQYNSYDVDTQCDAGWHDWFCKDNSLKNRLYKMAPMVIRIAESPKINQDIMYVWFKNNCPLYGKLYDDFRFADRITGDVIYTVIPKEGYVKSVNGQRACVWGQENNFEGDLVRGTMRDVYKFFGV